jgi:tetratricopeptide (TPR) repeat protein
VGGCAAAAAALTVGLTVLTSNNPPKATALKPRAGAPPVLLDLGVRVDAEASALRRAAELYRKGRRREAGAIFARYRSLQARVGQAFSRWPDGTIVEVSELAGSHPRSAFGDLHLGLAYFWAGRGQEALAAWRAALRVQPDSASAVRADDLLHPDFAQGIPVFVPTFAPPPGLEKLSPPKQLAALRAAAQRPDAHAKLLYGIALQRLGHPLSAERQYAAAARIAPADAEAQVARAVGRFSKSNPSRAFSQLGPLTRRFPSAATVRFHLGLLLLWTGRVELARKELRLAVRDDPDGPLGREAKRFLDRLSNVRIQ